MSRVEEVLEQIFNSKEGESTSTPFVELSIDYRKLRAVFVCSAGDKWESCKYASPTGLGECCSFLAANGECLNREQPMH